MGKVNSKTYLIIIISNVFFIDFALIKRSNMRASTQTRAHLLSQSRVSRGSNLHVCGRSGHRRPTGPAGPRPAGVVAVRATGGQIAGVFTTILHMQWVLALAVALHTGKTICTCACTNVDTLASCLQSHTH